MKFGVVVFPGSNCDADTIYVLEGIFGQEVKVLWHKEKNLKGVDFVFLPGGFSFGDYLRAGSIARFSPIMETVIDFAQKGGFVTGICNGFQVLCESHLLPGAIVRNKDQKFICKNVFLKTQTRDSLITCNIPQNKILKIPVAHADGRFFAREDTLQELAEENRILFKYCDREGNLTSEGNPNGSLMNIAGITNKHRNVFGLMPHPERASDDVLGNTDGRYIFESLLSLVK